MSHPSRSSSVSGVKKTLHLRDRVCYSPFALLTQHGFHYRFGSVKKSWLRYVNNRSVVTIQWTFLMKGNISRTLSMKAKGTMTPYNAFISGGIVTIKSITL